MLKIVGDICYADWYFDAGIGVGTALRNGIDPFKNIDRKENDYWIGNFECVCSNIKERCEFLIHPEDFSHIRHMDLYGVANNHVNQHGKNAYLDMLEYFDMEKIPYMGSLQKRSHRFRHQGKKVGIIAFCERPDNFKEEPQYWLLPEYCDLKAEIDSLADCDFRIAYVHWGNEFMDRPYIDQKQLAHFLIDCGIDLVVGMHPHVLQGMEIYKGKRIYYSIGNFVFNMAWEPTRQSLILSVDLSGDDPIVSHEQIVIDSMFPKHVASDSIEPKFRMESLNEKCKISFENEKYYSELFSKAHQYRKANYKWIITNLLKMNPKKSLNMISDFVGRKLKH